MRKSRNNIKSSTTYDVSVRPWGGMTVERLKDLGFKDANSNSYDNVAFTYTTDEDPSKAYRKLRKIIEEDNELGSIVMFEEQIIKSSVPFKNKGFNLSESEIEDIERQLEEGEDIVEINGWTFVWDYQFDCVIATSPEGEEYDQFRSFTDFLDWYENEYIHSSVKRRPVKSDLNVEDEAAYWDGLEDAACGLAPADEDDPSYMKGYRNGKKRSGRKSYADKICNDELASSRRINSSNEELQNDYEYFTEDEATGIKVFLWEKSFEQMERFFEKWNIKLTISDIIEKAIKYNPENERMANLYISSISFSFTVDIICTDNDNNIIDEMTVGLGKVKSLDNSYKPVKSSQKGYENVVDGTSYDDYHIDTTGMGILDVEHIINEIESRGNQAVLTVQTSDGATQHSQFNAKDWKAYKDAVNGVDEFSRNSKTKGAAITDVWVTEVEGGSYVRNSRQIKSERIVCINPETGKRFTGNFDGNDIEITQVPTNNSDVEVGDVYSWSEILNMGYMDDKEHMNRETNKYNNSRRPVKSSRFLVEDENGEVIAEADTYEEAQTVEGGAKIIDSESGEQEEFGMFQSKNETTKQTMTRILSSIVSGEMTEEEAAKEIAQANDCNIGYAKTILSYYMEDKERYLTSGMLELGEALNVDFDPDGNLDSWSVDFATDPEKPAPTLGGELVRAARLIIRSFRDNAEKIGWGYAREYLNPAARFIIDNTDYKGNSVIQEFLNGSVYDDDKYEQWVNEFETDFADYLRDHSEWFEKLNKEDFTQNTEESDEYGSIDYFSVNNEHFDYWFQYENGQYVCDYVDNGYDPEFQEGDVVTAEDYLFDGIDFDEEYGSFSEDGFTYWWEDGDGESVRISGVEINGGEFEEGDVLTPEELKELAEKGYKFHDRNGIDIKISDIL